MMWSINKIRMGENLLYTLLWAAIFFVPLLNAAMTSQAVVDLGEILEAFYKITPYFSIFIVNNNVIAPLYLDGKRYGSYLFFNILLIFVIFVLVNYVQEHMLARVVTLTGRVSANNEGVTFTDLSIWGNVTFGIFMTAAHSGIKLIYKSMRDDQKMEELKRENMQIEMDYLKYQINPHFFMNTLNNIHALIDIDTESAKRGVIELSKMMRYVLYESGSESISLSTDLKFIRNYIELMRIRFDENIECSIECSRSIPRDASIPPLLLIVFVENAFKHGMNHDGGNFVMINIEYIDNMLHCTVSNSLKRNEDSTKTSGIGLINVRKRLELLYGERFTLQCERREKDYFVDLTIPVCEQLL